MPDVPPSASGSVTKISRSDAPWHRSGFPLRHVKNQGLAVMGEWELAYDRVLDAHRSNAGSMIVLWGIRGTGKTQLATRAAIASFPAELCLYRKASDIFREIRESYRVGGPSEGAVFASFLKPVLLVIDEAQERGESAFEDRVLTHILDKRYDDLKHTIVISNLKKDELAKSLGSSVVSRIHEIGEAIECNWKSFREPRQQ